MGLWLPHPRMSTGADWLRRMTYRDSAGALVTLATSYAAGEMTVRDGADEIVLVISTDPGAGEGTVTMTDLGVIELFVPAEITETLTPGTYDFDFRLTDNDGLLGDPPLFEGNKKTGSALEIHRGMTRV